MQPPPRGEPPEFNEKMFQDFMDRFSILAEQCARFSREVYNRAGGSPQYDIDRTIRRNLDISRAVFSQYSIELLTVLYFRGVSSFKEIHRALGQVSPSLIVRRLAALERSGIVQRTVAGESPMDARYALTHKGAVVARLGEPVMLYIRLSEGWLGPVNRAEESAGAASEPAPIAADR